MIEPITIQSPNEILAQQIIARFIHEKLITNQFSEEIKTLLLSPSPTAEDWQLLVEKILESESRGK